MEESAKLLSGLAILGCIVPVHPCLIASQVEGGLFALRHLLAVLSEYIYMIS